MYTQFILHLVLVYLVLVVMELKVKLNEKEMLHWQLDKI